MLIMSKEDLPWSPATCAQSSFALTGLLETLKKLPTGSYQVNHPAGESANRFNDEVHARLRPLAEGLQQSLAHWGGVIAVNNLLIDPAIDGKHQLISLDIEQLLAQILSK